MYALYHEHPELGADYLRVKLDNKIAKFPDESAALITIFQIQWQYPSVDFRVVGLIKEGE